MQKAEHCTVMNSINNVRLVAADLTATTEQEAGVEAALRRLTEAAGVLQTLDADWAVCYRPGRPTYGNITHISCRHNRWGNSYVLLFQIVALITIRHEGKVQIWNRPFHTDQWGQTFESHFGQEGAPRYFLFTVSGRRMLGGGGRQAYLAVRVRLHSGSDTWQGGGGAVRRMGRTVIVFVSD